jgi:hypothetical protein
MEVLAHKQLRRVPPSPEDILFESPGSKNNLRCPGRWVFCPEVLVSKSARSVWELART